MLIRETAGRSLAEIGFRKRPSIYRHLERLLPKRNLGKVCQFLMKVKVLTSWSLMWLVATVLLVAGGALNLSQRAYNELPPTDGVLWVQKGDGIYAEKVTPGLAGSRAGISPGDKLLTISLDGDTFDEVVSVADVPMYLDAAGVGGTLTYYYQKTSYSFANNFYYADLKNIDTLPRWTPSIIFLALVGLIWLGVGLFVLFKQGSG